MRQSGGEMKMEEEQEENGDKVGRDKDDKKGNPKNRKKNQHTIYRRMRKLKENRKEIEEEK